MADTEVAVDSIAVDESNANGHVKTETDYASSVDIPSSDAMDADVKQEDSAPQNGEGESATQNAGGDHQNDDDDKQEPEQLRKLFIGGLTYNTSEEDLRTHFGKYGEIVDAVVMQDPSTKKSRCFGFITYKRASMVDEAQKARPHVIHDRTVEPKRAIPREMSNKPGTQATVCKAFVGGIKEGLEEADLREYFGKFGNLTSVDIITEKGTSKKRGFAFVTFEDYDVVDKLTLMRNHTVKGFRLEVQKAVSKEDMGSEPSGGRDQRGGGGSGGGGGNYRSGGGDRYGGGSGGYGDRDRDRRGGDRGGRGGRGEDRYGSRGGDDRYGSYGSRGGASGAYGASSYGSRGPSAGAGGWGGEGAGGYGSTYGGGYAAPPAAAPSSYGAPAAYGSAYPSYGQGDYGRYGGAPAAPAPYGAAPAAAPYGGAPDYGGGTGGGPMRSNSYGGAPAGGARSAPYQARGGGGYGGAPQGGYRR